MRAPDLALPTDGVTLGVDLDELFERGSTFVGELTTAIQTLNKIDINKRQPPDQQVGPLRDGLLAISALGVPGAFPRNVMGQDEEALRELATQRQRVLERVRRILKEARDDNAITAAVDNAAAEGEAEKLLIQRLKTLFGKGFPVLPLFTAANAPALTTSFGDSDRLQNGDPFVATAWLEQVAKVQARAEVFLRAMRFAEALHDQSHLALAVGQFPHLPNELWAGLPTEGEAAPKGGRVSMVAQTFGTWQFETALQGLVLDEWSEVIPKQDQTTSVTFHYDAPRARAPQAMLLLTLIDAEPAWTEPLIEEALLNTLDAVQRRLADANALTDGGHFLPTVYVETPAASGQLAGDLGRGLVADEDSSPVSPDLPDIDLTAP